MDEATAPATTGTLLGGRVRFAQPASGYRAAIDPVLLAASVPCSAPGALELGAGAGAAALCLATRCPGMTIHAVEIDPALAALARRNAADNGVADRLTVSVADIAAVGPDALGRFDAVLFNPPYLLAHGASPSPDPGKRRADIEAPGGLGAWIAAARRMLHPRGQLRLIHRADRLHDILALLAPRFGDIVVLPLWPRAGLPARRILVGARLGARGGSRLTAGLVLHGPDGAFSPEAEAVLRQGAGLDATFGRRGGG